MEETKNLSEEQQLDDSDLEQVNGGTTEEEKDPGRPISTASTKRAAIYF